MMREDYCPLTKKPKDEELVRPPWDLVAVETIALSIETMQVAG